MLEGIKSSAHMNLMFVHLFNIINIFSGKMENRNPFCHLVYNHKNLIGNAMKYILVYNSVKYFAQIFSKNLSRVSNFQHNYSKNIYFMSFTYRDRIETTDSINSPP